MMTRPHADLAAKHAIAPSHLTKRVHADQKKRRRCGAPLTTSATERSGNEGGQFGKLGPPADRRHIVVIGPAHGVYGSAASGVATRYMARPDAEHVGIYGAGKQARTQLHAVCAVRTKLCAGADSGAPLRQARPTCTEGKSPETSRISILSPSSDQGR